MQVYHEGSVKAVIAQESCYWKYIRIREKRKIFKLLLAIAFSFLIYIVETVIVLIKVLFSALVMASDKQI